MLTEMSLKDDLKQVITIFTKYAQGQFKRIILALFLALISKICMLGVPLIAKFIIDNIIVRGFYDYLEWILLIGVGVLIIEFITALGANYLLFQVVNLTGVKLKLSLFKQLQFAPFDFFKQADGGAIAHRTSADTEKVINFWLQAIGLLPSLVVLVITLGLIFSYHRGMSFLIIGLIIGECIVITGFKQQILIYAFLVKEQAQDITSFIVKHFAKIELVRSLAQEKSEQLDFFRLLKDKVLVDMKAFMLNKSSLLTRSLVNNLWIFIVLWYGAGQVMADNLTVGSLMAFLLLANILTNPVQSITELILHYQKVRASLYRVLEYKSIKPYIEFKETETRFNQSEVLIEVDNLSFGYQADELILKDINLKIRPKEITVLTGKNGSGKTTLAKLLIRFAKPKQGSIKLAGQEIKEIRPASLRDTVHLTTQQNHTFSGTIWDNLTYGVKRELSKKEVLKVIQKVGMDFFYHLPQGFRTVIGDKGINISGGEAQKIAFARALLKDPEVLILDEITASLDQSSEKRLKEVLLELKKEKTIIIIAHKTSLLDIADQILHFQNQQVKRVD